MDSERQPLAEISTQPTEPQMKAVKEAVKEMLAARNWTGSATVASLQARLSLAGHYLAEELLIKVAQILILDAFAPQSSVQDCIACKAYGSFYTQHSMSA